MLRAVLQCPVGNTSQPAQRHQLTLVLLNPFVLLWQQQHLLVEHLT